MVPLLHIVNVKAVDVQTITKTFENHSIYHWAGNSSTESNTI